MCNRCNPVLGPERDLSTSKTAGNRCEPIGKARSVRSQNGSLVLEAALTILAFLLLTISTMDILRILHLTLTGDHVLRKTARWALLGQTLPGQSREESIKLKLQEIGASFGISVDTDNVSICSAQEFNCSIDSAQSPGEIFYISYRHPVRFITLGINTELTFMEFTQNEPAPPDP